VVGERVPQNVFSYRMCSLVDGERMCVVGESVSYNRTCSLIIECVLL